MAMTNADVHLLLPACPQLLRLSCVLSEGWSALPVAAGCCSGLLEFSVTVRPHDPKIGAAASAVPEPVASPFLPELVSLCLFDEGRWDTASVFSALQHFTVSPHAQLQHVHLESRWGGVDARVLLSLACLLRLCQLLVTKPLGAGGLRDTLEELKEVRRRTRQQQLNTGTAGGARSDALRPVGFGEKRQRREVEPPLGPHQQQEMRQRVLQPLARE